MSYERRASLTDAQITDFWNHVRKTDGCWPYTNDISNGGYGRFWDGQRRWYAHVIAYYLVVGESPEGTELDHKCREKSCVRPTHLEPVTHAENVRRGRAGKLNREKTECKHGHKFDAVNTYTYEHAGRIRRACKECKSNRKRQSRNDT